MSRIVSEPEVLAWLDITAGVSGDMLLGALVDAGAGIQVLQDRVDAVLPGTVRLTRREVLRAGTRATKVDVELLVPDQPHRAWSEIRGLLERSELPPTTRDRALRTFERLAHVEAGIHAVPADEVHFHEVGAWDSVADVVAVCAGLEDLGVGALVVSPVALGSGSVRSAHGRLPVPVPAVLALATGWAVHEGGLGELATPTGMALVATLATAQGPLPAMTVTGSGVGAGSRDTDGRPNVVRIVLGATVRSGDQARGRHTSGLAERDLEVRDLVVLEANVDDLDPRVWPTVLDALLTAGAADAWLVPILMKKGRPAHTLCVLADPAEAGALRDLVLHLTSTIGVRETPVRRSALARGWVDVAVEGMGVAVKVAHRGGRVAKVTPEFSSAALAASGLACPVHDVLTLAAAAAVEAGLTPGAPVPALRDRP